MGVKFIAFGQFSQHAQIHHTHAIGNVFHHGKIVGNEEVGESHLVLKVFQHIHHLGPV